MGDATSLAYTGLGLVLSIGGAILAGARHRARRSFYAAEVYHMTERSHRRFAAVSVLFAVGFAGALRWPALNVPLLAIYALLLVLYLSSFARGFSDEEQ